MKVTFISHSDLTGGASVVTYRLMEALRGEGIDARMLVCSKTSNDPNVALAGSKIGRDVKFFAERARIFLANGFNRENLFKVSIANTGIDLAAHAWVKEADVVVLGWINQGLMSLRGVKRLIRMGKPVVWVMHDMWNATGICHHAYECTAYQQQCGNCRFLTGTSRSDLSHKIWRRKKDLYDMRRITFVAVSNWLAQRCASSSLMADADVRVIPNAFPADDFSTAPTLPVESLNIDHNRNLIVMGAARLDDPIKGFDYAIEALNYIADNHPEVARTSQMVFFGNLRDKTKLDALRFPYTWLGRVSDWRLLRQLYASARVVLSTSLYETLPGTLIEGQASGCLPVSFSRGGQGDIVTHLRDGYLAEYKNSRSIAEGILWALRQDPDREALHESVRQRFASDIIARKYIDLFNELIARNALQKP